MKMRWYLQYPDNVVHVAAIGLHFTKIDGVLKTKKKINSNRTIATHKSGKKWGDFVTWFLYVGFWSIALALTRLDQPDTSESRFAWLVRNGAEASRIDPVTCWYLFRLSLSLIIY